MANLGETLKRERESRKISLREVSEATKIGLRYLEAMEENRLDQLPGGLFNKGFIRAYAKFIGLNPETIVNVYLYDIAHQKRGAPERKPVPSLEDDEILAAIAAARAKPVPSRGRGRWMAATAAGGAIVIAGGLFILCRAPAGTIVDVEPRREAPTLSAGILRSAPIVSNPEPEPTQFAEPPAQAQEDDAKAAEPRAKPAPVDTDLALLLATTQANEIDVYCDGVEKVSRELEAGEAIAVSCGGELLLNAENAGVLSLRINGRECLPLGEMGTSLEGYLLNARKALEICPPDKEKR
jgi:hypothetical protein